MAGCATNKHCNTTTYGILCNDRQEFLKEIGNYFDEPSSMVSIWFNTNDINYEEEYYSQEEIPHSSIYLGNSNWLLYYKQNKGYMSVMRELDKRIKEGG